MDKKRAVELKYAPMDKSILQAPPSVQQQRSAFEDAVRLRHLGGNNVFQHAGAGVNLPGGSEVGSSFSRDPYRGTRMTAVDASMPLAGGRIKSEFKPGGSMYGGDMGGVQYTRKF